MNLGPLHHLFSYIGRCLLGPTRDSLLLPQRSATRARAPQHPAAEPWPHSRHLVPGLGSPFFSWTWLLGTPAFPAYPGSFTFALIHPTPPPPPLAWSMGVGRNLISFGRGGCQCVGGSSLPWGGRGRAKNPPNSCLKSLAPPLLEVGLNTLLPHLGGVAPSLPSSSDCPLEFRLGVLVTANVELAGRWGFLPLSRSPP